MLFPGKLRLLCLPSENDDLASACTLVPLEIGFSAFSAQKDAFVVLIDVTVSLLPSRDNPLFRQESCQGNTWRAHGVPLRQ